MAHKSSPEEIEKILELSRFADQIYPSKQEFLKAASEKRLVFYHGIDPTAPSLHLGHSTNLILLKKLHNLGHKIIVLVGSFTAQIGDPTGKLSLRKSLTKKEVLNNAKTYTKQISKILDFKFEVRFNADWLEKMSMEDVIKLMAKITHGKMIKRNMFQERLAKGSEIYLHEFMYPLLQGYDSVAMNVDGEVGGTDQTFNMLIGRDLLKIYKKKEKFVITTPLLENPKTGKKLMSKSEGNYIALDSSANDMFGKIMALPDEAIIPCFKYCTEVPDLEIKKMEKELKNPKDFKIELAKAIVGIYHGKNKAVEAEKEFENIFKNKEAPEDIKEILIKDRTLSLLDLLMKTGLAVSKSEARRLVFQKGVKIDGKTREDWQEEIEIKKGLVVQAGKRKFAKIKS